MKIIDRFTRDRVSRFLWGAATAAFLVVFLLALRGGVSAVSDEEQAAQERAVNYTDTVLFGALTGDKLAAPITGQAYRDLVIEVQGGIMTDPAVARVRVWAADGTLVFSTDGQKSVVVKTTDTAPIDAAVGGATTSVITNGTVAAKATLKGTDTQLYQTFAPLRVPDRATVVAAAEIDQFHGAIADAAAQPWRTLQIAFGIGFLLCVVLLILSLRRSTTLIGAGVGFEVPTPTGELVAADEQNILRMRNELQRAKEENRKLARHLEEAEAGMHLADSGGPSGTAAAEDAGAGALRLAEVQGWLTAAEAKTAELEHSVAAAEARAAEAEAQTARAEAVSTDPAVLASLEERVIAAEQRAREAELRLADLTESRSTPQEAPTPQAPAPVPAPRSDPSDREDAGSDEVPPLRPAEAADLRSRLARTAARKRRGSLPDEEHH
jgi:hypothetical protein